MIDAVIFDFDGVILDTEVLAYECWRAVFAEHGAALTIEDFAACVGTRNGIDWPGLFEQRTGLRRSDEELRAARDALQDPALATLGARDGVSDWIAAARDAGAKVAIASSSERAWIEPHLERFGWRDRFEVLATWEGEHTGMRPKPAPDLYEHACARLGVAPARALAVEDSLNGLRAAKAAGLWCVTVPNAVTSHLDLSAADARLASFTDRPLGDVITGLTAARTRP